jgi:hypothetical protein
MELTTFAIPVFRRESIQKRLDKLSRKAIKNGNPDIKVSFGKTFINKVKSDTRELEIEYIEVTVSGEAPRIAGWDLLARIELLQEENLIHVVPGSQEKLDQAFRQHDGHCDHCNSLRQRNDVYVLSDGSKQIAVGRTCLREFLGIDDPKAIVSRAQFFEELKGVQEEDDFLDFNGFGFIFLRDVLELAAANIRLHGYISKAKQMETGNATTGEIVMFTLRGIRGYELEPTEEDKMWAEKTLKFFRSEEFFDNDYMDNIRVILKQDIIKPQHVNLAASAVITAQRKLAPKVETKESNFIGEVKERLRGLNLILDKVIYLGDSTFGPSYLHLMKDENGNAFSWITGNKLGVAEGDMVKIDATVKQHKVYNDVKQTVLTRAKMVDTQLESV